MVRRWWWVEKRKRERERERESLLQVEKSKTSRRNSSIVISVGYRAVTITPRNLLERMV
jgi:hypothetical protein